MATRLLKNKYRLLEKIDEDERHIFFKAHVAPEEKETVAIRILKSKYLKDPALVQRLTNEAQMISHLKHPGIVAVYDIDFSDNIYFVVTEHVEGVTIDRIIREKRKLTLAQVLNYITQIAKILGYAFREGVKYRAVNETDILVLPNGRIKITGFSIPRAVRLTREYEKPAKPTVASDILFLGTLLYELLTQKLFGLDSLSFIKTIRAPEHVDLSEAVKIYDLTVEQKKDLSRLIYRSITGVISDRFNSLDEFLRELVAFIQKQVDSSDVLTSMKVSVPPAQGVSGTSKVVREKHISREKENEHSNVVEFRTRAKAENAVENGGKVSIAGCGEHRAVKNEPAKGCLELESLENPERTEAEVRDILFGRAPLEEYQLSPPPDRDRYVSEEAIADRYPVHTGKEGMERSLAEFKSESLLDRFASFWIVPVLFVIGFLLFLLYIYW